MTDKSTPAEEPTEPRGLDQYSDAELIAMLQSLPRRQFDRPRPPEK